MSLTGALSTTLAGLQNTEARINTLSQNVSNADKPGYTRKEIESTYISVNGQTVPLGGSIETVNFNPYLFESLIEDTSGASFDTIIFDFLSNYTSELGSIDGDNSLSSFVNNLSTALDRLTINPEDTSLKNAVVSAADRLAVELNRKTASVQDFRLQADQNIESVVDRINGAVARIEDLNQSIVEADIFGVSTANLEDDRRTELETLANLIDLNYFINSNNEVQIYTGGRPLLDSVPHTIEYTANANLGATSIFPVGFNPIDLDGFDITTVIQSGELGGLIELRDSIFTQEQEKLDEFSVVLIRELNSLLNTGASIPGRPTIIGEFEGFTGATPFGATGSVRIATTDANGIVQNFADIPLAGLLTITDLTNAINTALGPDVTASVAAPNGVLSLVANNAGEGLTLNQLDSDVTATGQDLSSFFGLNNFFKGNAASDIAISDYLVANGANLATSQLQAGALAIGDAGVNPGDSSLATLLNDAFTNDYNFVAAGNFAAQTENLGNYISSFISNAALQTSNAESNRDISVALTEQTKTTLQNISAVNVDEELANLIDLEAKYEASATMIATIQELFDTLLQAIR